MPDQDAKPTGRKCKLWVSDRFRPFSAIFYWTYDDKKAQTSCYSTNLTPGNGQLDWK
jgi:hypothetical protein